MVEFRSAPNGNAEAATALLLAALEAAAIEAVTVSYAGNRQAARDRSHVAVLLVAAGMVVDLTYRQFDPSSPWPLIEPVAGYRHRFRTGPQGPAPGGRGE